jgi:hypothetical protein
MRVSRDLGEIVTTADMAAMSLSDRVGPKFTMSQLIGETIAYVAPDLIFEPEDVRIVLKHMGWFQKLRRRYKDAIADNIRLSRPKQGESE